ncbi:MAG: hypothetical protein LUG98_12770 [Tannerellaceae bacterium]|nr:hypothetical protein [Tannerellaceae bacterium]
MKKLRDWIAEHPEYLGYVFLVAGAIALYAAIVDAEWLFGSTDESITYSGSRQFMSIDGLVDFFGRKPARYIVGFCSVLFMLGGAIWVYWKVFYTA